MPPDITYISKKCIYCLLLIVFAEILSPVSAEIDREVSYHHDNKYKNDI